MRNNNKMFIILFVIVGGFGDFYTMKRSQHPRPEVFFNSLFEGYDDLVNRVSALERKVMENGN